MTVISRSSNKITHYAAVLGTGEGLTGKKAVTLGDLEELIAAAKTEDIPKSTVVSVAGLFGPTEVSSIQVEYIEGDD